MSVVSRAWIWVTVSAWSWVEASAAMSVVSQFAMLVVDSVGIRVAAMKVTEETTATPFLEIYAPLRTPARLKHIGTQVN
ncbi:hypothetical protein H261_19394 [Paramagnetospirillum caucaseum]|uniref:Uncharacterized protein n=1 Tax=Paramagnetospirillum caucaseum TaxID=1244869 RepID=M2Z1S2_9PROT|nr:hypothetical protein H261_19394 [Paramagnetospirillum caucaseum]